MLAKNSLFNHNKRLQAKTNKELTSNGQALYTESELSHFLKGEKSAVMTSKRRL